MLRLIFEGMSDGEDWSAGAPLRAAGRSRPAEEEVPEFGPHQLIVELDCECLLPAPTGCAKV